MNRIEKLIEELCPNGVPFYCLRDVAPYAKIKVKSADLDSTNFVGVDNLRPNFGGREDSTYGPNAKTATAYSRGDVLIGNIRPYLKKVWLADRKGGASGDVLVLTLSEAGKQILEPGFLYWNLASDSFISYNNRFARGGKMPRGDKARILDYRIPVPPLEVQREIVKVLDLFTELEAELEAKLEAELEARRKQYEYYRDQLLTFPEDGGGGLG